MRRYRLQLASDNAFDDIVYDRAILGNTHEVTDLPPGKYFWRVAPATTETEPYMTTGVVVFPEPTAAESAAPTKNLTADPTRPTPILSPPRNLEWEIAVNGIASFAVDDFNIAEAQNVIAADAEGTIYSFDVNKGITKWMAQGHQLRNGDTAARRAVVNNFEPLFIGGTTPSISNAKRNSIVVRTDVGVRLIGTETGMEVWGARFDGRPLAGTLMKRDGSTWSIAIVTTNPDRLYFVESETGRVISQANLNGKTVGAPIVINTDSQPEILLAFKDGRLVSYTEDGRRVTRSMKLGTRLTTAPLLVESLTGARLLVGAGRGLVALRLPDLQTVWRLTTASGAPRGSLTSADLDGDGDAEAVMVTDRGRVAAIDVEEGVVLWIANGAREAEQATLADVNRDEVLDVIVAPDGDFANGYSGRDGRLVWQAEGERSAPARAARRRGLRGFCVVPQRDNSGAVSGVLLIGSDGAGSAVRAVQLPPTALSRIK